MTFGEQTRAISTAASHAAVAAVRLKCSLLPEHVNVNENGVSARGCNLSTSLESISVSKVAPAVVIPSDITKQVSNELPEARYAFREWRREEVS